jgi:SAM-dependent methyltransferase
VSSYDDFAPHYDAWVGDLGDDVAFYVEQARTNGGPVVELGVGTGRVAIPTARAGIPVIGVDASEEMLGVCRQRMDEAGVADLIDLRSGDFRSPPVGEPVPLVTCPFRSFLHLESDSDRREGLAAVRAILRPGGRFVFDVVTPHGGDEKRTETDWIERTPDVWQKDELDWSRRRIDVTLRIGERRTRLQFAWISRDEWRRLFDESGFRVHACYGWFDLSPCAHGAHSVWVLEPAD